MSDLYRALIKADELLHEAMTVLADANETDVFTDLSTIRKAISLDLQSEIRRMDRAERHGS